MCAFSWAIPPPPRLPSNRQNPPGSNKNPRVRQKETPGIIQRPLATIHKHLGTPAIVVCSGPLHPVKSLETSESCRTVLAPCDNTLIWPKVRSVLWASPATHVLGYPGSPPHTPCPAHLWPPSHRRPRKVLGPGLQRGLRQPPARANLLSSTPTVPRVLTSVREQSCPILCPTPYALHLQHCTHHPSRLWVDVHPPKPPISKRLLIFFLLAHNLCLIVVGTLRVFTAGKWLSLTPMTQISLLMTSQQPRLMKWLFRTLRRLRQMLGTQAALVQNRMKA